jgi:hypothetical protein
MTVQSHLRRVADPRQLTVRSETCEGRRRLSSPLLWCAITLFGASIVASAEPPAGSGATQGLGSADGEQTGTRAVITDLKRAGNTVTLKFIIYNDSSVGFGTGSKLNADGYHG